MIYEAKPGMDMKRAAITALKAGCTQFVVNGDVFNVDVTYERIGRIVPSAPVNKAAGKPAIPD